MVKALTPSWRERRLTEGSRVPSASWRRSIIVVKPTTIWSVRGTREVRTRSSITPTA